jgi:hypothetical protein
MPRQTYEEWIKRVDTALSHWCGMSHMDLPDWCYRDAYDDKVPPVIAARRALKAAKDG